MQHLTKLRKNKMPKPAEENSLRKHVENALNRHTNFEDIDVLLKHINEDKRADYLIEDRSIIIEQKEYTSSDEHKAKGKAYAKFVSSMFDKYNIDPDELSLENVQGKFALLTEEEAKKHRKLRNNFYDKIKDLMHKANKQIGSTKKLLDLEKSSGALLLVFDKVSGILPRVVTERVQRSIELYEHIDVVVYTIHFDSFLYNGNSTVNGMIEKQSSSSGYDCGRKIREVILGRPLSKEPIYISNNDVVIQTKRNIFE